MGVARDVVVRGQRREDGDGDGGWVTSYCIWMTVYAPGRSPFLDIVIEYVAISVRFSSQRHLVFMACK